MGRSKWSCTAELYEQCASSTAFILQSDKALFGRLCPAGRDGKRAFAPVMLRRLRKLGIPKTDPDELTEEEQGRCGGIVTMACQ